MQVGGIIAGIIAALIGAAVWGGIAIATEYEFAILAWGIGGLVGFAMLLGGARGPVMALAAGVLALMSIFAGKVFTVNHFVQGDIDSLDEELRMELPMDLYEEFKEDARILGELESDEQIPQYMIDREYTVAESAEEISDEEVQAFVEDRVPRLRYFQNYQPTYDQWIDHERSQFEEEVPPMMSGEMIGLTASTLGLMDILFAIFGLATAAGMVARADEE